MVASRDVTTQLTDAVDRTNVASSRCCIRTRVLRKSAAVTVSPARISCAATATSTPSGSCRNAAMPRTMPSSPATIITR